METMLWLIEIDEQNRPTMTESHCSPLDTPQGQTPPVMFWLVVSAILKNRKVNGKDYHI